MNRFTFFNTVLVLSALLIFTSCGKENEFNDHLGTGIRSQFLVDRIYDYNGNLLAEYIYDDNNKLTKRIITTLAFPSKKPISRFGGFSCCLPPFNTNQTLFIIV